MKLCVYFLFALCPWIVLAGDWALRWTEGNEQLQIAFVMLLFPLIMNALQYYIIDGFIKDGDVKEGGGHHALPTEEEEDEDVDGVDGRRGEARPLRNAWDASFDSEDEEVEVLKKPARSKVEKGTKAGKKKGKTLKQEDLDEYDPEQDGESSSSSRRNREDGK